MSHQRIFCLSTIFVVIVACGGGGGGGGGGGTARPSQIPESQAPSEPEPIPPFEWELASPDTLGIDSEKIQNVINYAMEDGFYSQAILVE